LLFAQGERLAAKVAKKIICVSRYDRDLALSLRVAKPSQLVVIRNGIDPRTFLEDEETAVQRELALENSLVVTFVGRLAHPKDPLTLLKAVQNLPKAKLVLVGDGPLRSEVEALTRQYNLGDRVILTGFRTDVPAILDASDVFVLATRWEGLPYVIIEAMMSGLPVVATDVGGVAELVEEGTTGFLVPPEQPEALAHALQKLLTRRQLRDTMGQAGRERALDNFTLDRMLSGIQSVYEDVLQCRL
jgi:glycosyltransferase involved in cell wall biosynthesis